MPKASTEKMKVIWEAVPDPDPEALQKAFAMLFKRGPYAPTRRGLDKTGAYAIVQTHDH